MVNKKNMILTSIVLIVIIAVLSIFIVKNNKVSKDEKYFKKEYERYNGKKNIEKEKYISLNIEEKNGVDYLSKKEIIRFMKNGTGVLFFGYPQSNFSRKSVNVLLDLVKEKKLTTIKYYNAYGKRDEKYIDEDGEIHEIKKGDKLYYQILDLLGDKAEVYEGLNDDSIKRLYFPTVLFIKDGNIKQMNVGTVDSNKSSKKLTKKEYKELKKNYISGIKKIKDE